MPQKEWHGQPASMGELAISEAMDPHLNRQVLRARLLDATAGTEHDILPELTDAKLLWMKDRKLRLCGFENIKDAAYAQTWSVEVD